MYEFPGVLFPTLPKAVFKLAENVYLLSAGSSFYSAVKASETKILFIRINFLYRFDLQYVSLSNLIKYGTDEYRNPFFISKKLGKWLKMEKEKIRNSNIELLRIVLILMIISLHYFNESDWAGGVLSHVTTASFNYYVSHLFESACIMAVNTFILITGYFSCHKTSIALAKPIKFYSLQIFYGIIFASIFLHITKPIINFETLKYILTSICYRWFVVTYCVLYILIPFLNKFIHSLTKKQLFSLLLINATLFYLINTFSPWPTVSDNGYGIVNFINLYFVGAYLKLYRPQPFLKKTSFSSFIGCVLFTTLFSFLPHNHAWSYLSIFNLISAIAIFDFFRALNIKTNFVINYLSSYTFAVYIIHECHFISSILYRRLFGSDLYWNSSYLLVNFIICVFGIYILCISIEFLRRLLLTKIWDAQIEKIPYKIRCE